MNRTPQPRGLDVVYLTWVVDELRREAGQREDDAERTRFRPDWSGYLLAGASVISVLVTYVVSG